MVCCKSPSAVYYNRKSIFWCAHYIDTSSWGFHHRSHLERQTACHSQKKTLPWPRRLYGRSWYQDLVPGSFVVNPIVNFVVNLVVNLIVNLIANLIVNLVVNIFSSKRLGAKRH